ncbi:hypothetical protein CFP56_038997 [Quercus suber]|uniref:Uncharacterized protein n=1 Tax=Quercus suber TaxID=58331 RepID=A0AAW0J0F8_QUESU
MSSRPVPAFALDSNGDCTNPKNQSISELVSKLRTAYRSKDFDRVEEVLVARETKLKREFENEKKQNALLTEKFQMENLDRIYLEDELENQKKALEAALERERKAEEAKNSKQDVKNVVGVLRRRICELECENVKAKGEVDLWKKRFEELGIRVSKLEEDIAMLTDLEPPVNNNGGGEVIRDGSDEVGGVVYGPHLLRSGNCTSIRGKALYSEAAKKQPSFGDLTHFSPTFSLKNLRSSLCDVLLFQNVGHDCPISPFFLGLDTT